MTQAGYTPKRELDAPAERSWWQHPWMVPLLVIIALFLLYVLPPYLHLNPETSRVRLDKGFPLHYEVVIGHILCGTIAMLTLCLQVWPWLLAHHPRIHRISGRFYVFAGALPTAAFALILTPLVKPHNGAVGTMVQALLWLAVTITGFVRARQRRYDEHRRWMIYSFAICIAPIWGRILLITLQTFPSIARAIDPVVVVEASAWCGWVLNLLVAQWWIERTARSGKTFDLNRPGVVVAALREKDSGQAEEVPGQAA